MAREWRALDRPGENADYKIMTSDAWNSVREFLLRRVRAAGVKDTREGRPFSRFSIIYGVLLMGSAIIAISLLRWTIGFIPPFIMRWFDLFQIREIFRFEFLDEAFIASAYETLIRILSILVVVRLAVAILQMMLSRIVLLDDRLIVIEYVLLFARVHYIPYERIARLSVNRTILHRFVDLGRVAIGTGDLNRPLKFGPMPAVSVFVAETMARMGAPALRPQAALQSAARPT